MKEGTKLIESINGNQNLLIGINFIVMIGLIFANILLWAKLVSMRRNYKKMLGGIDAKNLEDVLIHLQGKVKNLEGEARLNSKAISGILDMMKSMKSKVGIYRYNAFSEQGNGMSFSIAILDEHRNGVVLSGIHNREDTYIYAKPVQNGQSEYALSPEEKEAITRSS
jgi:hypothetical protein